LVLNLLKTANPGEILGIAKKEAGTLILFPYE